MFTFVNILDVMDEIKDRIAELIAESKLTHAEFAERTGLSSATISHILKGRNKPSLQVITQIKSSFTNVNIDYLLSGEGEMFIQEQSAPDNRVSPQETVLPTSFPMEGVRKVNVSGAPTSVQGKPEADGEVSGLEESAGNAAPAISGSDIEQVMIFYKDGRFKVYRP